MASENAATQWSLPLNGSADPIELTFTNTGKVHTDVWLQQRNAQGDVIQSLKLVSGMTPGEIITEMVDLKAVGFDASAKQPLLLYASQNLALAAFRLEAKTFAKAESMTQTAKSVSEVTRDELGRWHINGGENYYQVGEAMGYSIAQDRLFQAELYRRSARGRLAELYGPDFLEQDILARTIAYSEEEYNTYLEGLDPISRDLIVGYRDGFNRHIAELNANPVLIPAEFLLLGMTQLESWTSADLMSWVALLQRQFSISDFGLRQVENGLMLQALTGTYGGFPGVAKFLDFTWLNDPSAPTMIHKDGAATSKRAMRSALPQLRSDAPDLSNAVRNLRGTLDKREANLKKIGAYVKGGSYAWVFSGDRTTTGNPILYSGPQMGFEAPVILTEGSIQSDVVNVSGMTIPGIPVIIVGRSPHHAWSMQVGHSHIFDFYLEQESDVFVHRIETFKVLGGEDVQQPMLRSARGPILNQNPLLSWKYAHWGEEWNASGFMDNMANAQNPEEFAEGLRKLAVSQHFCYADTEGNIAYWMSGKVPVRPTGEYRVPQGFVGAPLEWDASNREPLPHAINPPQGWFGGWNNKARADINDSAGIWRYGSTHRTHFLHDIIEPDRTYSFEEIRSFALNIASSRSFMGGGNPWKFVSDAFSAAVSRNPTDSRMAAMDVMAGYDGYYVAGGAEHWALGMNVNDGWLLMDQWIRNVIDLTFSDDLAGNVANLSYRNQFEVLVRMITNTSAIPTYYRQYARNLADPSAPQTMDDIIVTGLDMALQSLGQQPWGEGARDMINYEHPLFGTVAQTPWASRSTWAQVVEVGSEGLLRLETMFPLGENQTFNINAQGEPQPHPLFFGMHEAFNTWNHRPFPMFEDTTSETE